jgi:UDP-N-acetylmuramoyl-tripeptide--D-alanyl-D-alanine ligase
MNLVIWLIYAAVTLLAIIFMGLREFHMLQLNGYKTPEHSWWMKKNFKRERTSGHTPQTILILMLQIQPPRL